MIARLRPLAEVVGSHLAKPPHGYIQDSVRPNCYGPDTLKPSPEKSWWAAPAEVILAVVDNYQLLCIRKKSVS